MCINKQNNQKQRETDSVLILMKSYQHIHEEIEFKIDIKKILIGGVSYNLKVHTLFLYFSPVR